MAILGLIDATVVFGVMMYRSTDDWKTLTLAILYSFVAAVTIGAIPP